MIPARTAITDVYFAKSRLSAKLKAELKRSLKLLTERSKRTLIKIIKQSDESAETTYGRGRRVLAIRRTRG